MSDHCHVELTFRKQDEAKFAELLWPDWYSEVLEQSATCMTVTIDDLTDTLLECRKPLAKARLSFYGRYMAFDDFAAEIFAASSGRHSAAFGILGDPYVLMKPDGSLDKTSLREAKQYLKICRQALKALGK